MAGVAGVTRARTADDGLGTLASRDFDVVLVGDSLPDLDGTELVRLLRGDPRTLTTPLVLLTDRTGAEAQRDARQAGVDDCLPRSLTPVLLEQRLLSLLTTRSLR